LEALTLKLTVTFVPASQQIDLSFCPVTVALGGATDVTDTESDVLPPVHGLLPSYVAVRLKL